MRQITPGLREHYSVEEMVGKKVLVVCNLKASKIVGFSSNGIAGRQGIRVSSDYFDCLNIVIIIVCRTPFPFLGEHTTSRSVPHSVPSHTPLFSRTRTRPK